MNFKPTKDKIITSLVLALLLGVLPTIMIGNTGLGYDYSVLWIAIIYFVILFAFTYFVFSLIQKK